MTWNPTNLLALWLASRATPSAPPSADKPAVVLVHGIFDSGAKMRWLASQCEQAGYEVFAPSLTPANGSVALTVLSRQLDEKIRARFSNERPLHLVGFSMGGLIARHWAGCHAEVPRVRSLATLSSPHCGTLAAWIFPGVGARDMRGGSAFLRELDALDDALDPLQPLSLYTPLDLIILPAGSSRWRVARVEKVWKMAHPLMVFSSTVARRLLTYFSERETRS